MQNIYTLTFSFSKSPHHEMRLHRIKKWIQTTQKTKTRSGKNDKFRLLLQT
jgi:hypothetical protein